MAYKIFILAAIVASASAGLLPASNAVSYAYQSAPVASHAPVVYAAAPVYQKYAAPVASVFHAAPLVHAAPVDHYAHYAPIAKAVVAEPYAPPHYEFGYSVDDPHTGDSKSHQESRVNDAVHGSYSLIDSDGFKRTVEYTADDHNGFNAVVHREPLGKVIAPVASVAYAAPAVKLLH